MKNEEMAKSWVDYHYDPAVKLTRYSLENAFLAGLKLGSPEWHKVADGDLPNENVKLILVRDRWENHFINYHLLLNKMIVEMIDQFDEWLELPIEE